MTPIERVVVAVRQPSHLHRLSATFQDESSQRLQLDVGLGVEN